MQSPKKQTLCWNKNDILIRQGLAFPVEFHNIILAGKSKSTWKKNVLVLDFSSERQGIVLTSRPTPTAESLGTFQVSLIFKLIKNKGNSTLKVMAFAT